MGSVAIDHNSSYIAFLWPKIQRNLLTLKLELSPRLKISLEETPIAMDAAMEQEDATDEKMEEVDAWKQELQLAQHNHVHEIVYQQV